VGDFEGDLSMLFGFLLIFDREFTFQNNTIMLENGLRVIAFLHFDTDIALKLWLVSLASVTLALVSWSAV
jgi:hypothetical protein